MKQSFLTAAYALIVMLGVACNNQSSTNADADQAVTDSSGAMMQEGMDHDDMNHEAMDQKEHTQMVKPEAVQEFDQVSGEIKQHIQGLTNIYLDVKNALVKESAVDAKAASEKMISAVEAFKSTLSGDQQDFYKQKIAELKEDAEHIIGTGDVGHQRDHFATLSKRIYELNKAFDATQKPLYYQHCPMAFGNKGAYWVSAEQEIKNPYFGSKMLTCGQTVETVN